MAQQSFLLPPSSLAETAALPADDGGWKRETLYEALGLETFSRSPHYAPVEIDKMESLDIDSFNSKYRNKRGVLVTRTLDKDG